MKADRCNRCSVDLLQDVNWHNSARKRRWLICKDCELARQRDYNAKNPDKVHNRNRRKRYGITYVEYTDLLVNQEYSCAICGGKETSKSRKNLSVDHDHTTGRVRGLLCTECNTGLGKFRDDVSLLDSAKDYLNASKLHQSHGR